MQVEGEEEVSKRWHGRTWGTLGDSITAAGGYQPHVQKAAGFRSVTNYGVGGCPMTAGGETDYGATVNVGERIDSSLDCVTIYAGVNDFRLNKPIGVQEKRDRTTFLGAYATLVEHIMERNPQAVINVWTPLQRDKDGYDIHYVNAAGHRLIDYAEAVKHIGEAYSLPVLDLYAISGFTKETLPQYTTDGLHPNEAGHLRIAELAAEFLIRL
ncbi:SGNH/GDSL hydrolase family protein [Paenibacillus sp. H1-7]|uniref:SGNH/GDSL hydrolase family protein n=1 Tax=Paenibacillus sp. H1-7 TaxID=2282849 RepID=UPI001EF795F9|nr:SGNH/GDSL hydrolase family protein [Paenibacillus sp. H1-7]ULL18223.1 SGNH/GDSL hydrolase family protein [Paenibacillus sp. H1-7]